MKSFKINEYEALAVQYALENFIGDCNDVTNKSEALIHSRNLAQKVFDRIKEWNEKNLGNNG